MRRQKITPGSLVAIEGIGGLGHLAIQYSKAMGFRTVAISHSAAKESFALDLGAHAYIDSSSEDVSAKLKSLGGAAMIVATSPKGNTTGALTGGLANHGTLLVLSVCGEIKVNSVDLIQKAVNVTGFPSGYALDSEETIAFTRLHGIKCMIEKFPLRDAAKALEHISDVRFRSVLIP
jgi:D-arabinose 1-dehydrogenase-like Zn-dependent alcohol dehydrogenase